MTHKPLKVAAGKKHFSPVCMLSVNLASMKCFFMQQIYRRKPMPKCDFNKVAWMKSHFGMGFLL